MLVLPIPPETTILYVQLLSQQVQAHLKVLMK
jgi:hypothetical protein